MLHNFSLIIFFVHFFLPTVKDMYDYQGRSYLHIPQDVGINLRSSDAPDKCYLPKKQIHVWSGHTKVSREDGFLLLCIHVISTDYSSECCRHR